MAYTINLTDGSIFATVTDGTINTDSSITVIGKNYAGYGEFLGENFVRMLENSANPTAPTNPLLGQLWYNATTGVIKVYNGTTFKNLGTATAKSTAPTSNIVGDLWFDTVDSQLKVWDGTNFITVGPSFTAGTGTSGAIVETIQDNFAVDHVVIKLYVNDEIVGIMSKDATFQPSPAIANFAATLGPGIQLALSVSGGTPLFDGTSTDAQLLDGIDSTGFISALADDATTGTLSIVNDGGLIVGSDGDAQLTVTADDAFLANITLNGDLILRVNDGGVPTVVITCDGPTGRARVTTPDGASHIQEIANKDYVDTNLGIDIIPSVDNTYDLGSVGVRYADAYAVTFHGESTSAQYADLAERFHADGPMTPGTVVQLGGQEEITKAVSDLSDDVFGVISTNAAFLMNAGAGNNETHPAVAMSGRVPVRVIGRINRGERLVSAGNGLARAALPSEMTSFNVIGRALETKTTETEGVIEAFVTVN